MFRFRYAAMALAACLSVAVSADAADDVVMLSIANVLGTPEAQQRLIASVHLYFATQPTPPVAREYGRYVAHHKTNGFAKSEARSCDWAFLGAVRALQRRADSLGGTAVINIESFYNRHEVRSPTEFECHKGMLMAGVVLRGDVVRLAGN